MRKSKRRSRNRSLVGIAILFIGALFLWREWNARTPYHGRLSLPELPAGFYAHGIDISHHQGRIDWDRFSNSSDSLLAFVYCKATEGVNHVDSQWESNRAQLLERGIHHGAYHFFSPRKDAELQAEHFLNHYTSLQSDLPPVLDAETEANSDTELIASMKKWLQQVEDKTGKRPVIYTSHHFYRTKFQGQFPGYKFWIANYNKRVNGLDDEQIICWQYSDNGAVPGIAGAVDMNFSKIKFAQ